MHHSRVGSAHLGAVIMRLAHRIARVASVAALIAIVGVLALLTASHALGYRTLVVRSGSMSGTADTGSVVIARPIAATDVEVGNVILIQRTSEGGELLAPVLHRVTDRRLDENGELVVQTKGDANPAPDPEPYALRGTTVTPVAVIPQLGFAVATVQTPVGWIAFVIIPLVLAAGLYLVRLWSPPEDRG